MRVLYLLNFAGKGGTERYVETLVRYLGEEYIEPFFVYHEDGPLADKLRAISPAAILPDFIRSCPT